MKTYDKKTCEEKSYEERREPMFLAAIAVAAWTVLAAGLGHAGTITAPTGDTYLMAAGVGGDGNCFVLGTSAGEPDDIVTFDGNDENGRTYFNGTVPTVSESLVENEDGSVTLTMVVSTGTEGGDLFPGGLNHPPTGNPMTTGCLWIGANVDNLLIEPAEAVASATFEFLSNETSINGPHQIPPAFFGVPGPWSGAMSLTFSNATGQETDEIVVTVNLGGPCGDGYREFDEECDDGNTASGDGCSETCEVEPRFESRTQRLCIVGVNEEAAKVAKAQFKVVKGCTGGFVKGQVTDVDACIDEDAKGKVAKAAAKAASTETKRCTETPDFGYTSAAYASEMAAQYAATTISEIVGPDFESVLATDDKGTIKCQSKVTKEVSKSVLNALKEYNECKESKILDGSLGFVSGISSSLGMENNCAAPTLTDNDVLQLAKLQKAADKGCGGVDLAAAFPFLAAACPGLDTAEEVAACAARVVRCETCIMLALMDDFDPQVCDAIDDGVAANLSCFATP